MTHEYVWKDSQLTHEYVWKDLRPTMFLTAEYFFTQDEETQRQLLLEAERSYVRLVIGGAETGHNAPAGRKE